MEIAEILKQRLDDLKRVDSKKYPAYEWQQACLDLKPHYGNAIWKVGKKFKNSYKMMKAFAIAEERKKVGDIGYLIGILKKL